MTREEIVNSMSLQDAIRVFKDTNCYGTMDIAKSVILKALEQEPIIDKIRTEIEEYQKDAFYSNDVMMSRKLVLSIIDKYKAEIEPQESEGEDDKE